MGFYQNHILPHLVNLAMRNPEVLPYRKRVISQAEGRVLEIGVGSGLNVPLYTDRAREILGIEPHPKLLQMAARETSIAPFRLVEGSAESIPLGDSCIDTVVSTWTMCSLPNPLTALGEIHRVLKPGGRLLFVEHGLAQEEEVRRRQIRWTPLWMRFTGGCHLDRPISKLVEDAGFHVEHLDMAYMRGPRPLTFTYEGSARPA